MPDIKTLNNLGEFLTVYGGWGVSILLGFFIMFLFRWFGNKLKDKDKAYVQLTKEKEAEVLEREKWWKDERAKIATTFDGYRDHQIKLTERVMLILGSLGNKIMLSKDEIRDTCKVIQSLLDAITQGVVKIKKLSDSEKEGLTQFFDEKENG